MEISGTKEDEITTNLPNRNDSYYWPIKKYKSDIAKKLVSLHLHPIAKLLRLTLLNKKEEHCNMCEI